MFTKRYPDPDAASRAAANHRWLAGLGGPLRVPRLRAVEGCVLQMEWVRGRHARPDDLRGLAGHLGDAHGWIHTRPLRAAHLDDPQRDAPGYHLPDFLTGRLPALRARLHEGVPGALLTPDTAERFLRAATTGPACLYKDTNPRNVLLTREGPVHVDLDDVTLAPFGYDLAKLVVTLAMAHGAPPPGTISAALAAYNGAADRHRPGLGQVTLATLLGWTEVHHALTWRYLGRNGYRHGWHTLRPAAAREVLECQ